MVQDWAGRKLLCGGGGVTRRPIFPNPPPPSLAAVTGGGGSGRGCLTCRAGGGGVNPTSMAQNDTHVALIILTTQIWGGGIIGGKNFFGPNFVFLCLWRQHLFLHKTKGPTRNPISPTPPPPSSFGGRPCHPPPPPAEQFSGCPGCVMALFRCSYVVMSSKHLMKASHGYCWRVEGRRGVWRVCRGPCIGLHTPLMDWMCHGSLLIC